jgi:spore coat polysaccharide biosynthesis protein SpsF
VATTTKADDDKIAALAIKEGVKVFRGSEEDVLQRVALAAQKFRAEAVVRLTADCPLVDWRIVDRLVKIYKTGDYDYVSNVIERSFPLGFDVEVLSFKKLQEIEKKAKEQIYREHPPYYFYAHPRKYRLYNLKASGKMNWPDLRVTLDTKEDYLVLTKLFEELYPKNSDFSAEEVVSLMRRHPEWVAINSQIKHRHVPRPTTA